MTQLAAQSTHETVRQIAEPHWWLLASDSRLRSATEGIVVTLCGEWRAATGGDVGQPVVEGLTRPQSGWIDGRSRSV